MIYTDRVHLVADSLIELHTFAIQIGLHRRYFEGVKKGHPHYDLIKTSGKPIYDIQGVKMSDKVLLNGAKLIGRKELTLISHKLINKI